MHNNSTEMKQSDKGSRKRRGLIVLSAILCVGAVGGLVGTSAFFTDQAGIDKDVKIGTMNMKVTDLSNLDTNYGTFDVTTGKVTGLIKAGGYQGKTISSLGFDENVGHSLEHNDPDPSSPGVINPGDDGVYGYQIKNLGSKSFDTAKVTTVAITLANAKDTVTANDAAIYQIEGLGTPYVSAKGNVLTLKYASNDTEVLSGSAEADGKGDSAVYLYNTPFDRSAKNKFQGADIKIDTTVYAKQHRNSVTSSLSLNKDGSLNGTGDWSQIANFETVVD